ncbi:major facilitator superfamily transporter [Trichoderma gamsii]|uniref:Major facilitator superfamily transporter n=1 Tax=Trichoderma gamsii TaxID=398673 RepID=A0A2P4ZIP5_9HYPO|nr:major facilitator superfamily transporter [Trichoderma gamsii]PON24158.1 major facilitator superfamily transporter [Trichoderma gamsii]
MAITKEHTSSDHATDIPGNNEEALELGTTRNDRSNEGSGISPENNKMIEQAKEEQRIIRGWRWALAYTSLMSTVLLFALDNTIIATIQPTIVETFGDQTALAWVGVSFVLGQSLILPIGKGYGLFNMKLLFIASLFLFEAGSAICGASPNMAALIIGRVVSGIGGSGVYVGGLTYISVLTTTAERPKYLAGVMSIWGFGNVLGPIVGGALAQSAATWRWGFYINLPIAGLFAPGYLLLLPSINVMPDVSLEKKLRMQDWVGIIIFTAFCACFCMAGSFGGTLYKWNSGSEITLWIMTVVLLVAFIFVTIYHPLVPPERRMMPVHFMRNKDLFLLPLQAFLVAGSMMMSIYYTPLIFQFTKGDDPLQGGVRILPLICMIVFGCLLNGFVMPKTGYYLPWYVIGNALLLTGAALMTTIDVNTTNSHLYGFTVLIGLGIGCFQSAGIGVVSALAPASEVNNAVSIMTVAQVLGIIVSLSVSGSVFQNMVLTYLAAALPDAKRDEISQLVTGTSGNFYQSLNTAQKFLVVKQVTVAIRDSFYYLVGITAIGFVTSLFLSRRKLFIESGSAVA